MSNIHIVDSYSSVAMPTDFNMESMAKDMFRMVRSEYRDYVKIGGDLVETFENIEMEKIDSVAESYKSWAGAAAKAVVISASTLGIVVVNAPGIVATPMQMMTKALLKSPRLCGLAAH